MRLLLDTHIWVRWLSEDQPLGRSVIDQIEQADYLAVSAISCWEVAYLIKNGKLALSVELDKWIQMALQDSGVEVIKISSEIAITSAMLPDIHRDPADRFIIATAVTANCMLATYDETIPKYDAISKRIVC
ncbi:MAG: type II toxin-antitoxin system VapC family toxin [Kiritimatiellia bacterium]